MAQNRGSERKFVTMTKGDREARASERAFNEIWSKKDWQLKQEEGDTDQPAVEGGGEQKSAAEGGGEQKPAEQPTRKAATNKPAQ